MSEENLIGYENGSHRLSEEYRNESAERLKGMNMNYLKLVSGCFHKNGYINRSFLKKVFQDMLSEKQIRGLISKMKNAGIIQKDGAGKYTRYVKAPDFPSFVKAKIQQMIIQYLQNAGSSGAKRDAIFEYLKEVLPQNKTQEQQERMIGNILSEMKEIGLIHPEGRTWFLGS